MTARKVPKAPAGMGPTGRDLWRRMHGRFRFYPHELPGLMLVCRQADDVFALEQMLAEQGAMLLGSKGQAVLNPAFAQLRAGRLALAKLTDALHLPVDTDAAGKPQYQTSTSKRASIAASARWGRVHQARESGLLDAASPADRSHGA